MKPSRVALTGMGLVGGNWSPDRVCFGYDELETGLNGLKQQGSSSRSSLRPAFYDQVFIPEITFTIPDHCRDQLPSQQS